MKEPLPTIKARRKGPTAIIEASPQVELWDEELKREVCARRYIHHGFLWTAEAPKRKFFTRLEKTVGRYSGLDQSAARIFRREHSITQGLIPSFARRHRNLSILHFDAHAGTSGSLISGSKHSHACAVLSGFANK